MHPANLFTSIIKAGWSGVEAWIGQKSESLHFECKAKDSGSDTFNEKDRDKLARAICGFANTEGGIVILGVHAKRQEGGPDVIHHITKIRKVLVCMSDISENLLNMIEPAVSGIQMEPITMPNEPDNGIIAIYVPESNSLPHRVVNCSKEINRQFFKRSDQHTYPMPFKDLASMFGRRSDANLYLKFCINANRLSRHAYVYIGNKGRGYAERPAIRFFQYNSEYPKVGPGQDFAWNRFAVEPTWTISPMNHYPGGGGGCMISASPGTVVYPEMESYVGVCMDPDQVKRSTFIFSPHGIVYALNMQPMRFSLQESLYIDERHDYNTPIIFQIDLSTQLDASINST